MPPQDFCKNKFSKQHNAFVNGIMKQQTGVHRLSNIPDIKSEGANIDDTLPFEASIQVVVQDGIADYNSKD